MLEEMFFVARLSDGSTVELCPGGAAVKKFSQSQNSFYMLQMAVTRSNLDDYISLVPKILEIRCSEHLAQV